MRRGTIAARVAMTMEFAAELMTPLTSVRQPMHQLGWAAADLLLSGSDTDQHQVFRPELIVRESSLS